VIVLLLVTVAGNAQLALHLGFQLHERCSAQLPPTQWDALPSTTASALPASACAISLEIKHKTPSLPLLHLIQLPHTPELQGLLTMLHWGQTIDLKARSTLNPVVLLPLPASNGMS
jgi:hypothetical protein